MLKLLVLITFISGVSTRGVPAADETNGKHVEPKGTETDKKDHSSEHVTLTECEDCKKVDGNDDKEARVATLEDRGNDKLDDLEVSSQTSKPKTDRHIKPFLTFHRIRVNVNRERKTDRKLTKKNRRRHHYKNSNVSRQTYKELNDDSGDEEASFIGNTRTGEKIGPNDKSKQTEMEVSVTSHAFAKELKKKPTKTPEVHIQDEASTVETIKNDPTDGKNSAVTEKESTNKYDSNNEGKQKQKGSVKQRPNNKQSVDRQIKEKISFEEKSVPLNISVLKEKSDDRTNFVKDSETESHPSVVKIKDRKSEKDYVDHVGIKLKDEKNINDYVGVKPKDESESVDRVGEKPKNEKDSIDHVGTKPKDKTESVNNVGVNSKAENNAFGPMDLHPKSEKKSADGKPKDEKGSIDHVIPKKAGDRWSRKGLSQVPDVERLERRLHPTVNAPVQDIIQSMRNMLKLIQSSLLRVDGDFKMIHNTTRWKYMVGVRDHLTELAEENDQVYDVVMEASLLTKEIYRKAHEHRHPQVNVEAVAVSYRSRLNTNMHTQMHTNYYAAQKELEEAKQLLGQIKASQNRKESLNDEKVRLYHLVRDRLPMRTLHDLYRRADQTMQILTAAHPLSRSRDKSLLFSHMRNDTVLNMRKANELTLDGVDLLDHARRVFMENKGKAQRHGNIIRNRLPVGAVADMPFDSGRMDLFVATDTANHHANSLSDRAAEIHMKLVPLIKKAKVVMANREGVGFQKMLDNSSKQLKERVTTLLDILDQIRIIIGDEEVLTERCKVLQSAVFFPISPLTCEDTLYSSGEGSGDSDDTKVDMEMTDTTKSTVTNGESAVGVDIAKVTETDKVTKNQTESPGPVSNINDIDDEDRIQELKMKSTAKTSPVTTSTPVTTTTTTASTTTGSSDGSDEDLFFDPFDWFNDKPDGDSIVISSDDDTGLISMRVNKTLNELIRERMYNYSQGSKELLEAAEKTEAKMNDVSLTWQKVEKRFATLKNNTLNGISVVSKWKAENAYFRAVHDRIQTVDEDIKFRKEIVDDQCKEAVERGNKKLKAMTQVYEKQSEKSKTAADPIVVRQAVSQVKVVVDNVNEITRLKQLYPSPCGTLESLDRNIRSNITELRKKIERAKLIASSLQIAVAVPKKEYLEFPISKEYHESQPLTSQVQMMLKHTGSNGRLVSLHVGESESLTLEVKNDELAVVQSIEGDEKRLSLYEDNIADKWYLIQLQRFAASYNFTMYGDKGVLGKVGTVASVDDFRPMTPDVLPTTVRLGASGDLTACALGLEINGRSVNMFDMGDNESIPTPCSSQGRWTSHQPHLLLDGSGYALIRFNDLLSVRTLQSIKVSFNLQSDGTVVFLQPRRMATEIDVYVEKGSLMIYVYYRNFETKLKSTVQVYSTDQVLEIVFKNGRTRSADVVLNGKSNVFKTATGRKREMKANSQDIFIGGIPMKNSSIVGCLKSLELNGEVIPFHNIYQAEGNHFGTCMKTECVKFDDNSIPIELENLTLVQSIHISVKRGSLGPILTYTKHKKKFNLIVSLNTEGLSIEETVDENTEDISLNGDADFIVVAIQDDVKSESVIVTVGDATEKFSYAKDGWGWGNEGKKDDVPVSYSVSLGTADDSPPFLGTIQNFILDGRQVDLLKYVEPNELGRCTLEPEPRKQDINDADIKRITCQ